MTPRIAVDQNVAMVEGTDTASPPSDHHNSRAEADRVQNLASPYLRAFHRAAQTAYAGLGISIEHGVALAALLRVNRVVLQRIKDVLIPLGLTPLQADIVAALGLVPDGVLTIVALRQKTLIHSATMTRTIDTLEKRGVVERRADPHNRRVVIVSLTAEGRKLAQQATLAADAIWDGIGELSTAQARELANLLSLIGGV